MQDTCAGLDTSQGNQGINWVSSRYFFLLNPYYLFWRVWHLNIVFTVKTVSLHFSRVQFHSLIWMFIKNLAFLLGDGHFCQESKELSTTYSGGPLTVGRRGMFRWSTARPGPAPMGQGGSTIEPHSAPSPRCSSSPVLNPRLWPHSCRGPNYSSCPDCGSGPAPGPSSQLWLPGKWGRGAPSKKSGDV